MHCNRRYDQKGDGLMDNRFNPKTRNLCIATAGEMIVDNLFVKSFNPKTRNLCIATYGRLKNCSIR